ncbi:MAG: UvrD-helicase domain-containing protein [Chloroflexi bacterium]|nr:UvrD-helicase domain-containing protein [Chloroflexota bacterium]
MKSALKELNLSDKLYRPVAVHAAISRAKNELIGPADFPITTYRDEAVKRIYKRYQELLQASNGVDFDDLLLMTTNLLADNPDVREKYAQRFRHVLVDEFQDTNIAQYNLIKHLSSAHHNVFCVGDPDQSVYRWRGADYRNVLRFEEDHPGCQTILLEQNYRSRQTILDAAMAVIDRNPRRKRKQLFSDLGKGEKIVFYEANDDYSEASFVIDTIAQLVASRQFEPGDCAVMYRTNAMSRLLEETFLQARLPYRLVGAQRFYGRREVKDIIAFLRLVQNKDDDISLGRIINVPPRGIGEKTVLALRLAAQTAQMTSGDILLDLARGSDSPFFAQFAGRAALPLADFGGLLSAWHSFAATATISELFDRIAQDIHYKDHLDDGTEEGKEHWENVVELHRLADEYETRPLTEFLENVALISDQDTISEGNVPTLLTLHAAKGLEFGVVFIVGLDDGILPHSRSFTIESRFLGDVPAELVSGQGRAGKRNSGFGSASSKSTWTLPSPSRPAQIIEQKFRAGIRVSHPSWGEGIVLDSRAQDGDEIVDVVFNSVGIKRLAASLAHLSVLK